MCGNVAANVLTAHTVRDFLSTKLSNLFLYKEMLNIVKPLMDHDHTFTTDYHKMQQHVRHM